MDTSILDEWVDKIFAYMEEFYKEKWTDYYKSTPEKLHFLKIQWKNGLRGLSKEEIKKGLGIAKRFALAGGKPLSHMEFWHYSKGIRIPYYPVNKTPSSASKEHAKRYLTEIRKTIPRGL